jgi:hypothetical protein
MAGGGGSKSTVVREAEIRDLLQYEVYRANRVCLISEEYSQSQEIVNEDDLVRSDEGNEWDRPNDGRWKRNDKRQGKNHRPREVRGCSDSSKPQQDDDGDTQICRNPAGFSHSKSIVRADVKHFETRSERDIGFDEMKLNPISRFPASAEVVTSVELLRQTVLELLPRSSSCVCSVPRFASMPRSANSSSLWSDSRYPRRLWPGLSRAVSGPCPRRRVYLFWPAGPVGMETGNPWVRCRSRQFIGLRENEFPVGSHGASYPNDADRDRPVNAVQPRPTPR